jgi:hypothetical protein
MLRGRSAGIAAALAVAATAAVTAGCGGGSTSSAVQLDPVSAAASKTQNEGAVRVHLRMVVSGKGEKVRMRGTGAFDGDSAEMSFKLGSMPGRMGLPSGAASMAQLAHTTMKEVALEQNGDYVIYLRIPLLSSELPGGKAWVKLDLSKLGKSEGIDLGQLTSGGQLQPNDLLGMLEGEGAKVQTVGPATIDGVATTHYRVTIDLAKALESSGLTSPMLKELAGRVKTASGNVWIGKDGLVRRVQFAYGVPRKAMRIAMTMDLYDYGAQISVAAPPSSAVFDATQLAQQGLGSMH